MTDEDELIDNAVLAGGLKARYTQAHRHYHNLAHIEFVLSSIEILSPAPDDDLAIRLAIWFHDAVYAPGRDDNEERSAFVAAEALEVVGASPNLIEEVQRLVLVTRDHAPDVKDRAGSVVCDADLRILASDPHTYGGYIASIRREYELIPDEIFYPARRGILETFLERPHLFTSDYARERWEPIARENIAAEIDRLSREPSGSNGKAS